MFLFLFTKSTFVDVDCLGVLLLDIDQEESKRESISAQLGERLMCEVEFWEVFLSRRS